MTDPGADPIETLADQMTPEGVIAHLHTLAAPDEAPGMAAYHKVDRPYLGIRTPVLNEMARAIRTAMPLEMRFDTARALWATNIHEARVLAAKTLEQARIRPDDTPAWALVTDWVPQFDGWAIADHVAISGAKRLIWRPERLDTVEGWTLSGHMWTRRAALVMTLPWARMNTPKPDELAARERILGWAAGYVTDTDWFIQKSVSWWLRELSKRDPGRVRAFLAEHGAAMKPFARRDASRRLPDQAAAPE